MLIIFILNSNKLWVVDTFKDLCHFQWCSSLLNGNFVNLGMSWMIFRIYEIFLNTCTYMYILVLYPVKFNIKYHLWFTTYHLINCNLLAPIFAVQSYLSSDIDCSVYRFDDRPSVVSFGFSLSKIWQCMQWYWLSTAWSLSEFL